ncbi:hypothetical protein [Limnobacter sp.]|uniref:hypothetical protein n=1 Tax=Limnobacter sp. TaxID=2003368 RepID=UPI0025C3B0AA|nr:hypothetical protein [Limnobacter sp.]
MYRKDTPKKKKPMAKKVATKAKAKQAPKAKLKKTVSNPKLRRIKRQGFID